MLPLGAWYGPIVQSGVGDWGISPSHYYSGGARTDLKKVLPYFRIIEN